MAQSSQKSIRQSLSAPKLFDKGRRLFGQSPTKVSLPSPPTTSQKTFKRSDDARHDIGVLAMTYILQDNPTIQDLIRLIIRLNNRNDGKLSEILALSSTFAVQLVSFHDEDSSEALIAITAFLTTMQNIDAMVRAGTQTTNSMKDMLNNSITQIKNAHPALGNRDWNISGDNGFSGILDTIIGTTSTILNIFNDASNAIPVPFVKPLVSSVASLLTAVQQTRSNLDDMRQVATVAGEFVVMLAVACAGDEVEPSRSFRQALDRFKQQLHDIAQECSELSHRNVLWRFFQQGVDQNSLSAIKQSLQLAVQQFQTEAHLLQHLDLRSLGQVINGKLDEDAVDALPKPRSHVGRRNEYLPGSRSDVIQVIADWLENPNQVTFWLHGSAGLGKSTLAHEIVDSLQADGRLATYAFLRVLPGSSSDPATVIQTMGRELGALHPRAIPHVAAAARACKASHQSLREYIEWYIIKPIRSLSYPYPLVIIVDGLDEWEHHEVFLKELEYILPSSPIKVLLISRPYHSIERSLLKVAVQKHELPPVSHVITEAYFKHHFEEIDWKMRKPSPITISALARLADGLLIWAAMVCSLLSNKMRPGLPHERLEHILSSGQQIALEGQLSHLYHDALKQLFQDNKEQVLFQRVFGAMTVLQESLPLNDFARLLEIDGDQVIEIQSRLTALQTRGTFNIDTVPPASERFHSSFLEFTINRKAGAVNTLIPYLIDPQMAHESVAEGCLTFLNHFLSSFRGRQCSHSHLRGLESYAVEFWPLHVANSNDRFTPLAPKLECLLLQLPENHLRQWGAWFLAISCPAASQDWDQVVGHIDKDIFYFSLANFLENNMALDITLASRRAFCLEVAIRLQPKFQKAWENLGDSYQTRFDSTNTLDLLNNAIIVYRQALELCCKDGSHLSSMCGLAYALHGRFEWTGSMTDLEESISIHRKSLSIHPTPHPDHFIPLNNLANVLLDHYKITCTMTDLDEAIKLLNESLSLHPKPHPDHFTSLNNLANALAMRFRGTGSMTDLEEVISMHRECLSLHPIPHLDRCMSLNNLANALLGRFGKTGSMADLEEAVSMHRESLSFLPAPHPRRSSSLMNLADALGARFRMTGSMIDLEESILMNRESLSLHPTPHPSRSSSLKNLGIALEDRFKETGSMIDLEESISMLHESLSLRPAPHSGRLRVMEGLAHALETRFKKNGKQSDLDEMTSLWQEILAISQ